MSRTRIVVWACDDLTVDGCTRSWDVVEVRGRGPTHVWRVLHQGFESRAAARREQARLRAASSEVRDILADYAEGGPR